MLVLQQEIQMIRKLMQKEEFCQDFGLYITNGYTKERRESVNDIFAVSHEILKYIDSFTVGEQIWSYHMPIKLTLNVKANNNENSTMNLLPKLKWDKRKIQIYKQQLNQQINTFKQLEDFLGLANLTDVV